MLHITFSTRKIHETLRSVGQYAHLLQRLSTLTSVNTQDNLGSKEHGHIQKLSGLIDNMNQLKNQLDTLILESYSDKTTKERIEKTQQCSKIYEDFINKIQSTRESLHNINGKKDPGLLAAKHSCYAILFKMLQKFQYWFKELEVFHYTKNPGQHERLKDNYLLQIEHATKRIQLEMETMKKVILTNQTAITSVHQQTGEFTPARMRLN